MRESSPQIPANTPAKLIKMSIDEVPISHQRSLLLEKKRPITESDDSKLALYRQFQHFSRGCSTSSKNSGSEEGEILEATTPADASHHRNPAALKRKRTMSSTSRDLGQELTQLAGNSSISSKSAAGEATEEKPQATTESLALPVPELEDGEIEEVVHKSLLKRKRTASLASADAVNDEVPQLAASRSTSSEIVAGDAIETPEVMTESLALPESTLKEESEAAVLQAAAPIPPSGPTAPIQSLASRRCMSSALVLVSLTSDFTNELALGMCIFFHFRDSWSVVGNAAAGCHCPIRGTKELKGSRAVDITEALIDGKRLSKLEVRNWEEGGGRGSGLNWLIPDAGLNEEGKERCHAEKVERARLIVEFWREGRCEVDGLSVLLVGERVRMFFVYRKRGG